MAYPAGEWGPPGAAWALTTHDPVQRLAGGVGGGAGDLVVPDAVAGRVGEEGVEYAVVVEVERGDVGDAVALGIPHGVVDQAVAVEVEPHGVRRSGQFQIRLRRPDVDGAVAGAEGVLDLVHICLDAARGDPVPPE